MGQKKENLQKLLKVIELLIKEDGNEWFHDELAILTFKKLISEKDNGINLCGITLKEIGSLDRYFDDGIIPMIDYSSISEDKIRLQLERDCLEMGKIRLCKNSSNINYSEFCKYAHFQAEESINYFFNYFFENDIVLIHDNIKRFNIKYNPNEIPKNLNQINYSTKLSALCSGFNLDSKIKSKLEFIKNVRNELSHRNSLDIKKEDEILIKCNEQRFNFMRFNDTKNFTKEIQELYFEGKFIFDKRQENWNEVYDVLNSLKDFIINNQTRSNTIFKIKEATSLEKKIIPFNEKKIPFKINKLNKNEKFELEDFSTENNFNSEIPSNKVINKTVHTNYNNDFSEESINITKPPKITEKIDINVLGDNKEIDFNLSKINILTEEEIEKNRSKARKVQYKLDNDSFIQ